MIDIRVIIEDQSIGYKDSQEILNLNYISGLCSKDGGLNNTINDNLNTMIKIIQTEKFTIIDRKEFQNKIQQIQNAIKNTKKTVRWRLRNLLGERIKGYQEEEVGQAEMY